MKLTEPPGPVPLSRRRMRTGRDSGNRDSEVIRHLGNFFREQRMAMEITGGAAGSIDHLVDASHLLGGQLDYGRDYFRQQAMVLRIEAQVHALVGDREIELLLRLVQRIGVGGWRPLLDLLRYAEVRGQLIDLGFVEVSDRFQIGGAVAILDKESLIVFEAVGGAGDGIVEEIRVVILHHLASALFEISCRYDTEIGIQGES